MFNKEFRISKLIAGYFRDQLNEEQQQELELWLAESEGNRTYFNKLSDDQALRHKLEKYDAPDKTRLWALTINKVDNFGKNPPAVATKSKIIRLWQKIAVAAAILVLLSGVAVILNRYAGIGQDQNRFAKNDIPAGGNKAYITFNNGKKINLSSQKNGVIIDANDLTYNDGTSIAANTGENITLSTPMGGTYQVVLPDGTKCWLNAASAIQFPSTFSKSSQRKVVLNGEAYFEVSKDKQHPFIVKSGGQEVQVLGTHFNVSSYAGEQTRTTLLEGSVQINRNVVIKPGEQATGAGLDIEVRQADLQANLAWKNGDFIFNNEPLESVMRQVSRWYNVDVIYAADTPNDFTMSGVVSRARPVSAILERMQGTGKVSFKIEGRKIYVSQ